MRSVDAPELDNCGGPEAKQELERLVSEKKVVVKEQIIDQMGRPMGLVYVDDKLVNKEILASGWGSFHSDTTDERENLKSAYDKAREESWEFGVKNAAKLKIRIILNVISRAILTTIPTAEIITFQGCAQYDFTIVEKDMGEGWFCTEKEAQKSRLYPFQNLPYPLC